MSNSATASDHLLPITVRRRVYGGWGHFTHGYVTKEEVAEYLRRIYNQDGTRKTGKQLLSSIKRGEHLMVSFAGTLTEIAECYQLAGEKIYEQYCNKGG